MASSRRSEGGGGESEHHGDKDRGPALPHPELTKLLDALEETIRCIDQMEHHKASNASSVAFSDDPRSSPHHADCV